MDPFEVNPTRFDPFFNPEAPDQPSKNGVHLVGLVQKLDQVWPHISYQYFKQSYDKKIIATDTHSEHDFFSVNAELGSHSSCWIGVVVRSRYIGVGQEISRRQPNA